MSFNGEQRSFLDERYVRKEVMYWRLVPAVVAGFFALIGAGTWVLDWHKERPHAGALEEGDLQHLEQMIRDLREDTREDVREIKSLIRSQSSARSRDDIQQIVNGNL